ncbi:hypothetical protein ACFP1Z_07415 [Streptomyces gamaensis]|uniref:Secreted protein n=1 Tax=Streptomyces gamaensis TaxID=1763542 RepID=A0ABW0YWL1_9ACTN
MKTVKYVVIGGAIAAIALGASGYSIAQSSSAAASKSDQAGMPYRATLNGFTFPLENYRLSDADQRKVNNAVDALTARCLQGFAITYSPNPRSDFADTHSRIYGVTDEAQAKSFGYRSPVAVQRVTPQAAVEAPQHAAVRTGAVSTYNNKAVPSGGCVGEAGRQIYRGQHASLRGLADGLIFQASDQARRDDRVREVFADWSGCMKGKGFSYKTPIDAMSGLAASNGAAGKDERSVAVADAQCKKQNNVIGVWSSVEADYQKKAISAHRPDLKMVQEDLQSLLTNADRALAAEKAAR